MNYSWVVTVVNLAGRALINYIKSSSIMSQDTTPRTNRLRWTMGVIECGFRFGWMVNFRTGVRSLGVKVLQEVNIDRSSFQKLLWELCNLIAERLFCEKVIGMQLFGRKKFPKNFFIRTLPLLSSRVPCRKTFLKLKKSVILWESSWKTTLLWRESTWKVISTGIFFSFYRDRE